MKRKLSVEWVFLDAGNTLVHIDFAIVADILKTEFGFDADPGSMEEAEPRAREIVDVTRTDFSDEAERERWRSYFFAIISAAGWNDRARMKDVLRVLFARNKIFSLWSKPAKGAGTTLEKLRESGYRCAVISNSDGSVEDMLGRLGLAKHLDFIIDSHVVGIEKPDPRIFRLALDRSGADPSRSLYVGDMFHIDVVGARAAGLHAAIMDPVGSHSKRDCVRLKEISDLPDVLRR